MDELLHSICSAHAVRIRSVEGTLMGAFYEGGLTSGAGRGRGDGLKSRSGDLNGGGGTREADHLLRTRKATDGKVGPVCRSRVGVVLAIRMLGSRKRSLLLVKIRGCCGESESHPPPGSQNKKFLRQPQVGKKKSNVGLILPDLHVCPPLLDWSRCLPHRPLTLRAARPPPPPTPHS